ncbi:CRISPR-associated protein Csm4 [Nitrincola tibetensis]|uniref:CRISPR system Cms protein Csm4 n=1 Tax=Nitrincola tibetensis TaxID=2219697 RepID=A0A364NKK4_9GAMM|nr:CRISPR-associated protein Csm4 [Nitrincola tibetensis]RAU17613.1 CRISPR-associated protein Csm4 [Nitrincola tibetensis]
MKRIMYKIRIQPQTAFATSLRGDTLFGQACWHIVESAGEEALTDLLEGYLDNRPFMVLSDAFPADFLPRPTLPLALLGFDLSDPTQRKLVKSKRWLDSIALHQPLHTWSEFLSTESDIAERLLGQRDAALWKEEIRNHNSLNRLTNTTGKGEHGFAPFERAYTWYHPQLVLDLYACVDERLNLDALRAIITAIGQSGYGKEASSGAGKFTLLDITEYIPPKPQGANAWITLAPSAPQGLDWISSACFYNVHVRFGRHGSSALSQGATPWKNPLLLADAAALLTPQAFDAEALWVGQGLTNLSHVIRQSVHQGYSPVVPIAAPDLSRIRES